MNWTDIAAITSIVACVVTAATLYLRLFVANQNAQLKEDMHDWLRENYHSAAIIDLRLENLDARISRLEASGE